MQVIEVKDSVSVRAFHQIPFDIYKNDPNWVPQLQSMDDMVFDPNRNANYKNGDGTRWILLDNKGKAIGRIAAFFIANKAFAFKQPTGGCGYFECIDNQDAANLLFDIAKFWLTMRGMAAMDGPVNFGENLLNWGLLVKGFMQQGFGMPYNKPYYLQLFQNYGFEVYFEQYSYHLNHKEPFPERFWKIAEWVAKKPDFRFEHVNFNKMEKYIQDFVKVYEQAWVRHDNHQSVNLDDIRGMMKMAKLIADEELIWFAYHNDEPVLFFGMIPDWNMILKKLNGKSNWRSILKFLWYKKMHAMTRARILIMGVVPKYQGTGLESAVFWHMDKVMQRKLWINEVELSWVGDLNPKMVAIYMSVGGVHAKTHYTMRYLFDRNVPFERAPMLTKEVRLLRENKGTAYPD